VREVGLGSFEDDDDGDGGGGGGDGDGDDDAGVNANASENEFVENVVNALRNLGELTHWKV